MLGAVNLIRRVREGERAALDDLVPLVYAELRKMASGYLRNERPGHTLQPTALVNEVYLRLVGAGNADVQDRTHFLGTAAFLMRQVLTQHARRRQAAKRGGGVTAFALNEALDFSPERDRQDSRPQASECGARVARPAGGSRAGCPPIQLSES